MGTKNSPGSSDSRRRGNEFQRFVNTSSSLTVFGERATDDGLNGPRIREYSGPPRFDPYWIVEPEPVTPFYKWSRHLDGADEHRCNYCQEAFVKREPLCEAGQALYDASH